MPRYPSAVHSLFHECGGMPITRWLQRHGACIMMYHCFPADQSLLTAQCEYLRKHHRVISISDLSKALHNNLPLPDSSVVITIDDGHRDLFTNGYPVFAKYGFPATVYLATGPLDDRSWLWFDRVEYAFCASPLRKVSLPNPEEPAAPCEEVELGTEQQRISLATKYMVWVTVMPNQAMRAYVKELEEILQVDVPEAPTERYALLTWDEIKSMAQGTVTFGGHTVTHPILTRLEQEQELREEIVTSKRRIESELNRPSLHFAYPSGRPQDLSPAIAAAVRDAGFETSVTTTTGQVLRGDDPFFLKRISFHPGMPTYRFRQFVAGFRP